MVREIRVFGLAGIPLIKKYDNLAEIIVAVANGNGVEINDGDIFIVAQKVISKSEGRVIKLECVIPSRDALEISEKTGRDPRLVDLVLRESKRLLKVSKQTIIVEDQRNIVNIIAGIDKSNVEGENYYALLPKDPDKSAKKLRYGILRLIGKKVGIVISDTYSRSFRRGQVNFAIGISGINPFVDYRGTPDLFGYILKVKFSAVADEIAAAAELVMGQGAEATPIVIVRGLSDLVISEDKTSSKELIISEDEDLFRNVR